MIPLTLKGFAVGIPTLLPAIVTRVLKRQTHS
jgi:hypothetical protein